MKKIFWLILFLAGCVWCNGCIDKTFFPKAALTVVNVDPYYVAWEKQGEGASATYTLPNVRLSLQNDSGIRANLKSVAITYRTRLDEVINDLPAHNSGIELLIGPSTVTEFDLVFNSLELYEFISLTKTSIFPIKASFLLQLEDINRNHMTLEANCLIFSPDATVSSTSPSSSSTSSGGGTSTTSTPSNPSTPSTQGSQNQTLEIEEPKDKAIIELSQSISISGKASSPIVSGIRWYFNPQAGSQNEIEVSRDKLSDSFNPKALQALVPGTYTVLLSGFVGNPPTARKDEITVTLVE